MNTDPETNGFYYMQCTLFTSRFLRKTPMCASRIETAWLFHEIGNCFLALGDFEYAKDAAKKSLEAAEEAVEWSYQLQSCVLMGVAEGGLLEDSTELIYPLAARRDP